MEDMNVGTVKDVVIDDYRAAAIFEKYGIDFCCGGKKTLRSACDEKGVDPVLLIAELRSLKSNGAANDVRFAERDLDTLVDFIVSTHHLYVQSAVPILLAHTNKVAQVHRENHPELLKIAQVFQSVAEELLNHMTKEERILFPYIKRLAASAREGTSVAPPSFGTIQNPIRMMEAEHQSAGDAFSLIRAVTGGYKLPLDACTTYRVTFKELEEFEKDLHQHVHLENNILFPRAIELEKELVSAA